MKSHNGYETFLTAYCKGATADMVQSSMDNQWGPIWSIKPCDTRAMELIARQINRTRAQRLRHFRRAVVNTPRSRGHEVMVCTEIPSRKQDIYCLKSKRKLIVNKYLNDAALNALEDSFIPAIKKEKTNI